MVCAWAGGGGLTVAQPSPLNWGHPDEISGNIETIFGHPGCNKNYFRCQMLCAGFISSDFFYCGVIFSCVSSEMEPAAICQWSNSSSTAGASAGEGA